MIARRLAVVLGLACPACVPLTQIETSRTRGDISVSPSPPFFSVALRTPTLDPAKKGEIDAAASYARDSRGRQYPLLLERIPSVEDYPEPSYFLQRKLSWISAPGRPRARWPGGKWSLHVELVSARGREIYETDFRLSPLIWTPFLGPPN